MPSVRWSVTAGAAAVSGAPSGGVPSVVRSGTSLSSQESTNGMAASATPQRNTPCSACANAWRKSA